jgi:outer membrane protein, heavy metal efflux system
LDIVPSSRSASTRSCALVFTAALLSACQSPAPRPTPERAISTAVGFDEALTLHAEGEPLDEAWPDSSRLSLSEALARSLRSSPELQASLARVRIALADAEQARLLPNPLLDVILRFPEGGGQTNIEAGISADLLSLLQRPSKSSAADERLRVAVAEAVSTSLAVAASVQERYAAVQALDELSPLLRERRTVLAKLIALARSRLEFGEASKLDVTTLEAQGVELDLEISERESERREERIGLARSTGQPSNEATWTLDGWPALPNAIGDEAQWLEAGMEHRPEILARRWELAALGDEAAAVGLSVLQGSSLGVDAQRDGGWSVGPALAIPLPLFDTGTARRDRAEAAIIEARHGLVSVQRTVVEEVRRAHASYISAQANLQRVRTELMPLQRQRREQVEAIYLAGQADLTAVLLAEQDLQAAQGKLVELERKTAVTLVRLERAVGGAGIAKQVGRPRDSGSDGGDYVQKELE